jgi:hypothetical protein
MILFRELVSGQRKKITDEIGILSHKIFPTSAPAFGSSAFRAFSFSCFFSALLVLPRFTISTTPHIQNRWIHTCSFPVVVRRRFIFALPLLPLTYNAPKFPPLQRLVIYRRHKLRSNPRGRASCILEVLHIGLGLEQRAGKCQEAVDVRSSLAFWSSE